MGRGGMEGGGAAAGAGMLLSHTADLQLTDAQVVKLAAIARREGAQRTAMRAMMDSVMRARPAMRTDSAARGRMTPPPQMTAAMTRARDQRRADLRDAITVLTPDQQAQAWEMVSARGAMARGAMRRRMGGGMGARGMGQGMQRGRGGMMPGPGMQDGRMQGPPPAANPPAGQMRARQPQPGQRPPETVEPVR